jgi:hypothetical protein
LWDVFNTTALQLIKEEADRNRLYNLSGVWSTICVEMNPVSSLICNCDCLPYNKMIYRSKERLPLLAESSNGFIYRFISSQDLSINFFLTTPFTYRNKSRIKYNRTHYAFTHDGYLYTPDHQFDTLVISGIFKTDISNYNCDSSNQTSCGSALNAEISLPDYMRRIAITMSLQELGIPRQISQDHHPNNNSTQQVTP